jgi:phosphohistidine phosphatase
MKELFILRHAKSSWDNADIADFDRPLNQRGLKAAPYIGQSLRNHFVQPEVILSSPAKRAKHTSILVKQVGELETDITFDDRIYEASPSTLLRVVTEIADQAEKALLVGHNPGLEGLLGVLTGETQRMPTATMAKILLDVDSWSEITPGCGYMQALIRPPREEAAKEQTAQN